MNATKVYRIRSLYNLHMKEPDSVQTQLNEDKSINSQISTHGMTINDELKALTC